MRACLPGCSTNLQHLDNINPEWTSKREKTETSCKNGLTKKSQVHKIISARNCVIGKNWARCLSLPSFYVLIFLFMISDSTWWNAPRLCSMQDTFISVICIISWRCTVGYPLPPANSVRLHASACIHFYLITQISEIPHITFWSTIEDAIFTITTEDLAHDGATQTTRVMLHAY